MGGGFLLSCNSQISLYYYNGRHSVSASSVYRPPPFLRSADRALRANPQYFSNQKHIIMKKIKTCDYVAPECEEYSMIPEKGVFMSDNLIETETPDVETW